MGTKAAITKRTKVAITKRELHLRGHPGMNYCPAATGLSPGTRCAGLSSVGAYAHGLRSSAAQAAASTIRGCFCTERTTVPTDGPGWATPPSRTPARIVGLLATLRACPRAKRLL